MANLNINGLRGKSTKSKFKSKVTEHCKTRGTIFTIYMMEVSTSSRIVSLEMC